MDEIRMYTKEEELEDTIESQKNEIIKLSHLLVEKNCAIEEQCSKIERLKNLLKGKDYTIEQQLKVIDCYRKKEIRELKEKLNKGKQDTIGYAPVNFVLEDSNSSYSEYAIHLMRKYEALTDHGFSHDDAMSLIPMWDDADFENFKKGN